MTGAATNTVILSHRYARGRDRARVKRKKKEAGQHMIPSFLFLPFDAKRRFWYSLFESKRKLTRESKVCARLKAATETENSPSLRDTLSADFLVFRLSRLGTFSSANFLVPELSRPKTFSSANFLVLGLSRPRTFSSPGFLV